MRPIELQWPVVSGELARAEVRQCGNVAGVVVAVEVLAELWKKSIESVEEEMQSASGKCERKYGRKILKEKKVQVKAKRDQLCVNGNLNGQSLGSVLPPISHAISSSHPAHSQVLISTIEISHWLLLATHSRRVLPRESRR